VVRRLNDSGFEAYLVGGCVRDMLLGLQPKDFDIATAATPRQVKRIFRNSRVIGRRFRLVHVVFGDKVLEVSTFRALAKLNAAGADPMIHEDNTWGTAAEDALRRDFTLNGLFYDIARGEVIDYVSGLRDLDRRCIETIGNPWVRFREDPVRMLRAVKFAGRLGLHLANDVYQAIVDGAADIAKASGPRVHEEIVRMLDRGGAASTVSLLEKTGLLGIMLPEIEATLRARWADGATPLTWRRLAALDQLVLSGTPVSAALRFAVLFGELVEPVTGEQAPSLPPAAVAARIEELLQPVLACLHMPRRDLWMMKQIWMAQRRFQHMPEQRKLPHSHAFLRREYFVDALHYLRFTAEAEGSGAERARAWAAFARGSGAAGAR
jgi:poly(A) polymerase